MEAIKSCQVHAEGQDKQYMMDDLDSLGGAPQNMQDDSEEDEEIQAVESGQQQQRTKNYRSNSQKLTTLIELATQEDLSEACCESPPKLISQNKKQ